MYDVYCYALDATLPEVTCLTPVVAICEPSSASTHSVEYCDRDEKAISEDLVSLILLS